MTKELAPRDAFEAKLLEVYSEGGLVPMCHDADEIRRMAINPFRRHDNYRLKRLITLPSGNIVVEAPGECRATIEDKDTIFTLAFTPVRYVQERRWLKDYVTYDWRVAGKTVSLIMNHEFDKPAALIGPGTNEFPEYSDVPRSAAVIVYDEVNNPDYLKPLLPIVAAAGQATYRS